MEIPRALEIIKMRLPALINRMEANMNGGSSLTAILFHKYVDPQITYIAKKATTIKTLLLGLAIVV